MEELIKTVSEKAGINAEQARNAVSAVMDFIKNKVPGIGEHLKGMISGEGGGAGMVDALKKKIGI